MQKLQVVMIMTDQVKSKQRVADYGEVFTAEREVKAMCDLVKDETERIDSRFLEPACGEGAFLTEILRRKLAVVRKKYSRSITDYEKNSLLAVSSLYGVDILADNAKACRERLFEIWDSEYKAVCGKSCSDDVRNSVQFILGLNIICGNGISMRRVDDNGNETEIPIVFSEWAFISDMNIQRSDYTFDELLNGERPDNDDMPDWFGCFETDEGTFLKKYVCDYRKLGVTDNG